MSGRRKFGAVIYGNNVIPAQAGIQKWSLPQ